MEKFTLFWDGPFSQWVGSDFEFEGMTFDRAEQFMMFCKAAFFEDWSIAEQVMNTPGNPKKQKALGRKVKNFNVEKWATVAKKIVYSGSYCKYKQNIEFWELLRATDGTTLVEASPYDKVWGIGLSEFHPDAVKRSKWKGTNWLGEVLTQVREDIKKQHVDESALKVCQKLVRAYKEQQT